MAQKKPKGVRFGTIKSLIKYHDVTPVAKLAVDKMVELVNDYIIDLALKAKTLAKHSKRKTTKADDVVLAHKSM